MDRRALPKSLESLRVFDAAARRLSFTEAARELLVTQAAVSRRIQALEAQLGRPLFERRGRRLALTEAGARLAARVATALDYLEEGLAEGAPPLTIAASGSVSALWLAARLRERAAEAPGETVRLRTTESLAEAAEASNDLTILYAEGPAHPVWALTPIFAERLAPVAAPAHLAARGIDPAALPLAPGALGALAALEYDRVKPEWVTLGAWLRRRGAPAAAARRIFTSYALTVEAAIAGEGMTLGSLELLAGELAAGRLLRLTAEVEETGRAYHLGLKREGAGAAERGLHDWLLAAARRGAGGAAGGGGEGAGRPGLARRGGHSIR